MSSPGCTGRRSRLHWPPRHRVWPCPGNMCQRASVGGPGISRPHTHPRFHPCICRRSLLWGSECCDELCAIARSAVRTGLLPRASRWPSPGGLRGTSLADTICFSCSANTDVNPEEKETLWEYAQHLQEPTGIFHGVPGVTPAKIIAEMSYQEIP